ncbi:MAG: HD domain-containing phosphohydrolase, partial [Terriglobia bacterium]
DRRFVAIKVWNREPTIVYASDQARVGRTFRVSKHLRDAFEGRATAEIDRLEGAQHATERSKYTALVEVYTPVHSGAEVIGAFEIYYPATHLLQNQAVAKRTLWAVLGAGMLVLYGLLFFIVRRTSKTLVEKKRLELAGEDLRQALEDTKHAERALETVAHKNEALLRALPDMMFRVDRSGRFLDYRAREESELFIPPEKITGQTIEESMPPEFSEPYLKRVREALETGQIATFEYDLVVPQGLQNYEARLVKSGTDEVTAIVRNTSKDRDHRALKQRATAIDEVVAWSKLGLWTATVSGDVTFATSAACRLSGHEGGDVADLRDELIKGWPAEKMRDFWGTLARTGQVRDAHFKVGGADGNGRTVVVNALAGPDEIIGTISEISQTSRFDEPQRGILEKIVENADASITASDAAGNLTFVSKAACRMLGYSVGELNSQPLATIFSGEGAVKAKEILAESLKTGRFLGRARLVKKNGKSFPAALSVTAVRDSTGATELIQVLTDITDHVAIEESFRRSPENFTALLEASGDAIGGIDRDGFFLYMSPGALKLHNIAAGNLKGKHFLDFVDAEHRPAFENAFNEAAEGKIKQFELERQTPDGPKSFETTMAPVPSGSGKTANILMISKDLTTAKLAAENVAIGLRKLGQTFQETVQSLSSMLETRDPYTAGHQERVSLLASAIAEEMHLPTDTITGIRIASLIHDIGKINIPAEILSKPSSLDPIEFEIIKTHSEVGYQILKGIDFPWPVAETMYQHHERMDGSGYPRKLSGAELLVEARILAVADVVEAMCSHRPYRPTLGLDAALDEIAKGRGTLYDERVADACLALFRKPDGEKPEPESLRATLTKKA